MSNADFILFSAMQAYPDFANFDNDASDPEFLDSDSKEMFGIQAGRKPVRQYIDTFVWQNLTERFGEMNCEELRSIARLLSQVVRIPLERYEVQSVSRLVSWFENNWNLVSPFLPYVVIEEETAN